MHRSLRHRPQGAIGDFASKRRHRGPEKSQKDGTVGRAMRSSGTGPSGRSIYVGQYLVDVILKGWCVYIYI